MTDVFCMHNNVVHSDKIILVSGSVQETYQTLDISYAPSCNSLSEFANRNFIGHLSWSNSWPRRRAIVDSSRDIYFNLKSLPKGSDQSWSALKDCRTALSLNEIFFTLKISISMGQQFDICRWLSYSASSKMLSVHHRIIIMNYELLLSLWCTK